MAEALDEFMICFDEQDWADGAVSACKPDCDKFQSFDLHENLYLLTSHIYTFQQKGFEAKHQISIKSLSEALERNRELLEDMYPKLSPQQQDVYRQFYDEKRRFKCTRITCRYFSEGFADANQKKKHINMHNRPFHCDVTNCLGNEGFTNNNDLLKYVSSCHHYHTPHRHHSEHPHSHVLDTLAPSTPRRVTWPTSSAQRHRRRARRPSSHAPCATRHSHVDSTSATTS
jgi:hypothetical protein